MVIKLIWNIYMLVFFLYVLFFFISDVCIQILFQQKKLTMLKGTKSGCERQEDTIIVFSPASGGGGGR